MNISVGCIVFAKNRKAKTLNLLSNIRNQSVPPDNVLLIENIKDERNFNFSLLKQIFPSNHINVQYRKVLFKNIAESRELALKLAKTELVVFMDNDISIPNDFIYKIKRYFLQNKNVTALVSKVLSTDNSLASVYGSILSCHGHMQESSPISISHYGMGATILNMHKVTQLRLAFDTSLDTAEDVDFFLTLKERGEIIIYNPQLEIKHDYKKNNLFEFVYRYYVYAKNFLDLEEKHPDTYYHFAHLFPRRKIHWMLLPFYILSCSLSQTEWWLPKKFWPIAITVHLAFIFGLYNSPKGKCILTRNFKNNWLL